MAISKKTKYTLLLTLIAIVATIYFGANTYIKYKLENKLGELINTSDNPLYTYHLGNFDIEIVSGTIKLSDISVQPTEFALASVKDLESDLRMVGGFTIEEVLFEEFEIENFFKTGEIELKQFKIIRPSFVIQHNVEKHKADTTTVLGSTLSDKFISAYLGILKIEDANLIIKEINETGSELMVENINILLTESYVDPETIKKPFPFDFENITVSSSGLFMDISDRYEIKSENISFDIQSNSFEIDSFKLIPKYTHKELEELNEFNVGEYEFDTEQLIIEGFDFKNFKYNGEIHLKTIKLINSHLVLYNNKNKPFPPKKEKILWATALQKIPLAFTIDTLIMDNSDINIHEKSKQTKRVSNLFFEDMNVTATGISTDTAITKENKLMLIKASTKILGKGKAKFNMKVDLTSKNDDYWVDGTMNYMRATTFNQVLNPLFNVNIVDGEIQYVSFHYYANNDYSKGKMDLHYTDLKMELHSKKDTKKKNRFSSMLVNTVIKQNNIKGKKSYKQGVIYTERNKNKSSFNYLWKSIMSGIVTTMVPDRITKKMAKKKK